MVPDVGETIMKRVGNEALRRRRRNTRARSNNAFTAACEKISIADFLEGFPVVVVNGGV